MRKLTQFRCVHSPRIVGTKGATVSRLRAETGADIFISRDDSNVIELTGGMSGYLKPFRHHLLTPTLLLQTRRASVLLRRPSSRSVSPPTFLFLIVSLMLMVPSRSDCVPTRPRARRALLSSQISPVHFIFSSLSRFLSHSKSCIVVKFPLLFLPPFHFALSVCSTACPDRAEVVDFVSFQALSVFLLLSFSCFPLSRIVRLALKGTEWRYSLASAPRTRRVARCEPAASAQNREHGQRAPL